MRFLLCLLSFLVAIPAFGDEGFWTFDNPPRQLLKEKYDYELTDAWLEHVRLSAVRIGHSGSGSFVSPQGLVLTNYHVGNNQVQKLSTAEHNYINEGFLARTQQEELKTPDLAVHVLVSIIDVTEQIHAAGKHIDDAAQARTARQAEIARIEQESSKETGLYCDVITLYNGKQYQLYQYKIYDDVRLVFAPDVNTAFFGGRHDNYTYPRYSLDFMLFRVYENNQPLQPDHYLKWNVDGPQEDDLLFVVGNPGRTDRSATVAQLEFNRDYYIPLHMQQLENYRNAVYDYLSQDQDGFRKVWSNLQFVENTWKRVTNWHKGLSDTTIFNRHIQKEKQLRNDIQNRPHLHQQCQTMWDNIRETYESYQKFYKPAFFNGSVLKWRGSLFGKARTIVEMTAELEKPNEDRLEDYRESNLGDVTFQLYSPAPVYPQKEAILFAADLQTMVDELGMEHPLMKTMLQGQSPQDVAQNTTLNTKLIDPKFRRQLVESGRQGVENSNDPMIILARRAVPFLREYQKRYEDEVESVIEKNGSLIADAIFELYGSDIPPDANFTLRLSLGEVKGYPYNGTLAPYKTTLYGMVDRSLSFDNQPPFALPETIQEHQHELDLSTPVNYVLTADVVGGNSGSPVVNTDGELAGLIFDGNVESIIRHFIYTEEQARSVAVHPAIMIEVLRKVYAADHLVKELSPRFKRD